MNEQILSQQIYECALKSSQGREAPISYINIELGFHSDVIEESLVNAFNTLKWDTPLSSSELFITRKPHNGKHDKGVKVVSLVEFEDEYGKAGVIPVKCSLA